MPRTEKKTPDSVLVDQFKSGSLQAFEELVERYETKVFNLALRYTRNQEDAEEVLQDVFSTIFTKVAGFQGKSAFSSWLYRIIVNASFMKLRKRKQHLAMSIDELQPHLRQQYLDQEQNQSSRADTESMNHELRELLEAAVNRLPDQYRAVFILRDVDGLSNQEVSEVLQLSVPAVKSRLHRSRLMLRKKLQRYYDDYRGITDQRLRDAHLLCQMVEDHQREAA